MPHHVVGWLRRRRGHRRTPTVEGNAQLLLYSRILPSGFLHYGYFDDPDTAPEAVSFADLERAQRRYAELLAELTGPPGRPVLDAGSGMGGMLGLLRKAGHDATGLTPDLFQVEHIRSAYPDIPLLHCKFEEMPVSDHRGRFGAVLHAESVQYMVPEQVFPVVDAVLAPGGRWVVADYFRRGADGERSGWRLPEFRRRAQDAGFRVARERDITPHVLPTLGFAHMLAHRLGLPAFDFARDKLRAKHPATGYVLEEAAAEGRAALVRSLAVLDPAEFAARKRYLVMVLRRNGEENDTQ